MKTLLNKISCLALLGTLISCSHQTVQEKSAEKAQIYLQLATEHLSQRNYGEALKACQSAIQEQDNFPAAYNHLGLVFMETKRYSKAEEAFQKALELHPRYPEVHNNYGVLLGRMGKHETALSHFREALSDPNYSTPENAFTNMGHTYLMIGDTKSAKTFHHKALDVLPQFCLANKNMGDTYLKEKNYSKAVEYFNSSLVQCPLYQESRFKLGLALVKAGNRQQARAELEKLVNMHKEGPFVGRSRKVLNFIK